MKLNRRTLIKGFAVLGFLFTHSGVAFAADTLNVGILIPGSKSDKGWMESGYNGLVASQDKYGDALKVQMIEKPSQTLI